LIKRITITTQAHETTVIRRLEVMELPLCPECGQPVHQIVVQELTDWREFTGEMLCKMVGAGKTHLIKVSDEHWLICLKALGQLQKS
jgi:hypothetical protein